MDDESAGAGGPIGKRRQLLLLAAAEALGMGLWFSASAVLPQLTAEWSLGPAGRAWMTMSVQLGFVVGALVSAVTVLSDRVSARALFATSAAVGAAATAGMAVAPVGPGGALALRFVTGVALAGVYPPGMKLVATWCREDRGLGIGLLVGALTLGTAFPHLLNALPLGAGGSAALETAGGMPPWRTVLLAAAGAALLAAVLALAFVRPGPWHAETAPFDWRYAARVLAHRPTRLANFGYLGHMWELYAMWAWVPIFLLDSYAAAGWGTSRARVAGFAVLAAGAVGSVVAGALADRFGRCRIAIGSLWISGGAALVAGALFGSPGWATAVCLVWGFAVVADSAQFSAAVSELTDARYVGTALTLQTSLGFLLTLVTLRLVPFAVEHVGWAGTFPLLALGPLFGIRSMARLRRLPEARLMASGRG